MTVVKSTFKKCDSEVLARRAERLLRACGLPIGVQPPAPAVPASPIQRDFDLWAALAWRAEKASPDMPDDDYNALMSRWDRAQHSVMSGKSEDARDVLAKIAVCLDYIDCTVEGWPAVADEIRAMLAR